MDERRWGNYSSCCRLCLDDKIHSLRSIFEDVTRGLELVKQIQSYIGLEVKPGDKLSTMICEQCLSKVHMWNIFKKSCFENQDKLVEWMNKWEADNSTNMEIQIKQEAIDQSYESMAMDEDIYDDPPPLTLHPPEIILNSADYDAFPENEINQNEQNTTAVNGVVVTDANSTICSFCDKNFSNPFNRRRHERDVHKHKTGQVNKEPTPTASKNKSGKADVQKIQFAAGLQLKQRSAEASNLDSALTNVELSYLDKCKNIILMTETLICVCHNERYEKLTDLIGHLKKLRSWFAMFTCYNCLITFCDRGSYMRHYCSCSKDLLINLKRLSEFSSNSEIKIRIYQNFKCLKCNLIFAFHEDFCNHLDNDHMEIVQDSSSFTCICSQTFEDGEELKQHLNVSCYISYYCDACFTSYSDIDAFRKHCETEHDQMDGSSLESYDYYHKSKVRIGVTAQPEKSSQNELRVSTRRRTLLSLSSQTDIKPVLKQEDEDYTPKPRKVLNPHAFRHMKSSKPATCPDCNKVYSSYHNMLRHYTIAHDESGLILTCTYCPEKFRLISELREHEGTVHEKICSPEENAINGLPKFSCPDCKNMFNTSEEWKKHIESHPKKTCEECGKQFNLQSDFEQHRSVHLNIKVYRDSKTQNYKSTMLNPSLSCTICEINFDNNEELHQHKLLHDKMPELSVQEDNLLEERKDDSKKYSCTPCNKNYLSYAGIYDHLKKHHPDQEVAKEYPKQCSHCDKVLLTRGAYGNHQRMHDRLLGLIPKTEQESPKIKISKTPPEDEESYYTCKRCFKVFSSKYNLKNHMKSHGLNLNTNRSSFKTGKVLKTYWCDICHQACVGYSELQEHKQEHRQVKEKVINIVSEPEFPQHNNPFIFICDICSSSFSTNFALKRHREKHDQETAKPNTTVYCKYCKIPFADGMLLAEHMLSEHEETPLEVKQSKDIMKKHACKICKKVFDNGGALASHQGWHKRGKVSKKMLNDVKPIKSEFPIHVSKMDVNTHICTSCSLQFINETALQIHILETHRNITRVLSLNCSSCRTSFESKSAFDTHMELHKVVETQRNLKPFPCKYCSSRFSRNDTLNAHIKQHHTEQYADMFNCTQCERTFDRQSALTTHLKVHERHRLVGVGNEIPKSAPKSLSNKNLYFCSICHLGFAIAKDLRTHVITAHPF